MTIAKASNYSSKLEDKEYMMEYLSALDSDVKMLYLALQGRTDTTFPVEGTSVLSTGETGGTKYLREDGDGTCSWQTVAGGGNVSKVGTPVDNQVGVWTGDGTIEGTTGLTYDGSNLQLTGDIGSTGTRITKGWFTDLTVTNAIAGSITGNADTVSTITGLAPDTATTQATQPNITSVGTLTSITTSGLLTTNGQIKFPATANPSADVNTLDDYEEGTFTPRIEFGGGTTGITYGVQIGTYTKIGNRVFGEVQLTLTSKGSSTGTVQIQGMPFTSGTNYSIHFTNSAITFADSYFGQGVNGAARIVLYEVTNSGVRTNLDNTNFANDSELKLSFQHYV